MVDGDDLARAADPRALDDRQADPAAAKTATVCPASSPALRSAAPTPVSTPQPTSAAWSSGDVGVDAHDRVLVQQHLFGVGRDVDELAHRLAALRQARRLAVLARDDAAGCTNWDGR